VNDPAPPPDWYRAVFADDWLALAGQLHSPEGTAAEVEFVVRALALSPGNRVLDVPCGHGRHAVELARRRLRVTGVDLSEPSLALARAAAAEAGVAVSLHHADMRDLPWVGEFDAAVNLFSSFGYLEDEAQDQRALGAIARALAPGGRLLMEMANPTWVLRHFEPRRWDALPDGLLHLADNEYDAATGRITTRWTFVRPDGSRGGFSFRLRAYTAPELTRMLVAAGLEQDGVWGGLDGSEYGTDARRLAVRARRPG
jgi:SAM-dependent methyltransferase